jgi:MFS family permease
MIHQCYFFRMAPFLQNAVGVPESQLGAVLAIGQVSEIFFLAVLGFFVRRLGYKWVLTVGALGYMLRFAIYALGEPAWAVIAAQTLHGVCYGFFFAGAFMYVDAEAPEDARHSAQTVFGIVILGVGPILAGFYNQSFDRFVTAEGAQGYVTFWWVQAAVALASAAALAALFRPRTSTAAP